MKLIPSWNAVMFLNLSRYHTFVKIIAQSKLLFKISTAEVQKEVERIYELTKGLNMVVIDCDAINHPSQLLDCSLAPIAVYIKMEPQILEKLVKLRGSKRKNLGAQVVAAQKLAQCNEVRQILVASKHFSALSFFLSLTVLRWRCAK